MLKISVLRELSSHFTKSVRFSSLILYHSPHYVAPQRFFTTQIIRTLRCPSYRLTSSIPAIIAKKGNAIAKNLGRFHYKKGKRNFFFTPIGLMSFLGFFKSNEEEKEDEMIMTLKRSVLLIQKGELPKAERMLHVALKLAQERQSADGITYVYDLLANVAMESGELAKAEKLFVTVMQRLMGDGVQQDDNRVIHISLKLAEIYLQQSDRPGFEEKAKEGFRFCIDALQKKMEKGDNDEDTVLLLSVACEGRGKMMAQGGHFREARDLLQRAATLSAQSGADIEERQASLLSDLGAVCSMSGDDDAALQFLKQAVEAGRKGNSEHLPAFLVNLGLLSLYKGMRSEATRACKEAYNLSRSAQNKDFENEAAKCLDEINKLKT